MITLDSFSGETSKLVADYKFRASKAEQDVLTLQATVARLESQVIRYKSAMEQAEKMEDELKCDRRKLQREVKIVFRFNHFIILTYKTTSRSKRSSN